MTLRAAKITSGHQYITATLLAQKHRAPFQGAPRSRH
jgi:hypothetical protein